MATFRVYCGSPVDFNPEIHQDIHGADHATRFYEMGTYLNFFTLYGVKEADGEFEYVWETTVWISDYKPNAIQAMISKKYGDDVIFCQEVCQQLLNQTTESIPEGDLIISILFVGIIAIIGLKRKIVGT